MNAGFEEPGVEVLTAEALVLEKLDRSVGRAAPGTGGRKGIGTRWCYRRAFVLVLSSHRRSPTKRHC